jgi:hypothetical protein
VNAASERRFRPPEPVGEPYRADPADPAPFLGEHDSVPAVPVEHAPVAPAGPPFGHPPTHSPDPGGAGPVFRRPSPPARPATPEERFARTAFWVGVASIFVFNVVIGPIAMVLGLMAIRRGERRLGTLAIICGAAGTAIGVLLLVLVSRGVLPTFDEMMRDIRNGR